MEKNERYAKGELIFERTYDGFIQFAVRDETDDDFDHLSKKESNSLCTANCNQMKYGWALSCKRYWHNNDNIFSFLPKRKP